MGIDANGTRFLLYCKNRGVDFSQTATIGRQKMALPPQRLEPVLAAFGYQATARDMQNVFTKTQGYAEYFLKCLGARATHSFDFSDYEGATHLHDMNRPLAGEHKNQYSVVLDCGTLEHVFNFPVAIKNCLEMVRVGGHFLTCTPVNNFMGHGFYQFSPELYYNVLSAESGFQVEQVIIHEDEPDPVWYDTKSPADVRGRVKLCNARPVYMMVYARRTAIVPVLASVPQQSDYTTLWTEEHSRTDGSATALQPRGRLARFVPFLKKTLPRPVQGWLLRSVQRAYGGFDPRFYKPISPTAGADPTKYPLVWES